MTNKRKKNRKIFRGHNLFFFIILLIIAVSCVMYFFDINFNERSGDDPLFGDKVVSGTTVILPVTTGTIKETTSKIQTSESVTSTTKKVTESETEKKTETSGATTSATEYKPETKPAETTQKQTDITDIFIDRSVLNNIGEVSNKEYSWWIYLNKENKPSTIDPGIARIISPYNAVFIGNTDDKSIYLTFDEGYENGYTASILDTLKKHDVKAVFFITGFYFDKNPELVDRMVNEGHVLGNHSVNHPGLPTISNEKIYDELYDLDKKIYNRYGIRTYLFRPPSGEYSERTLKITHMLGYTTVFWSYAYDDWYTDKIRGPQYAYDKVISHLHNGGIYLLHAVSKDNAEALDSIITECKNQGYQLKLLQ